MILVAVLAFLLYTAFQKEGRWIRVTVDEKEFGVYTLEQDQIIEINDTNTLEIKDGKADMIAGRCPDKLCVHQKAISNSGESIICLPLKIVVSVVGGEAGELDAVAG